MDTKTYLIALIFAVAASTCQTRHQNIKQQDCILFEKLIKMKFEEYKGKSVNSFLSDLNFTYSNHIPGGRIPGVVSYVVFEFGTNISVDISVNDLYNEDPLKSLGKFDLEVFKSKTINWICFRFYGKCIKGCNMQPCDIEN